MDILIGALAAWGLIMLVWTLLGVILMPIERGRDPAVTVVLRCKSDAAWLSYYLRGIFWLRDSGLIWWDVLILDEGMGPEAGEQADLASEEFGQVKRMNLDELKDWMESKHDGGA